MIWRGVMLMMVIIVLRLGRYYWQGRILLKTIIIKIKSVRALIMVCTRGYSRRLAIITITYLLVLLTKIIISNNINNNNIIYFNFMTLCAIWMGRSLIIIRHQQHQQQSKSNKIATTIH